ncbi:MAG: ISKra4 family transposase [Rhodobacteraceae bacterium]|nr:ISKra4 family transposase [Paracoccaceae bacterium]
MMTDEIVAAKVSKINALLSELLGCVDKAVEIQPPLHEFERDVLGRVLEIGHNTIQLLLDKLGHGNVGEEFTLPDGRTLKRSEEPKTREYQSIFGSFMLVRYVYARREGQKAEFIPLDARLALPESKFSYLLQDFDQHLAMEEPFQQVSVTIERILGIGQYVESLERMNHKMSEHVGDFHMGQAAPPASEEGAIVVETADGKGVPIRRPPDALPIEEHEHKSGPKPDRKKMATIASVYTIDPYPRTPEQVVESLFRDPQAERSPSSERPRPCHKRVRGCLNFIDSDEEQIRARPVMFGWMADEVAARNPHGDKPVIAIMDGEESLWSELDAFQGSDNRVEILDLLHVTPRLWKAARIFCTDQKEAAQFVRQRLLGILRGEVDGVIRGFQRMVSTRKVSGRSRSTIGAICNYFKKHRHRMRYDYYLAEGYPIASGAIEGACRNVVKDRMERTGMNWVIPGAQSMLALRCVYLSDHWDEFFQSYFTAETERLHPHRNLIRELSWTIAV